MQSRDSFGMGFRALKERPLETGLIVLGITLASCVAAASLLLLLSQKAQSDKILQGPAYREILVSSATDAGQSTARAGITLIDQKATQSFQLDASDLPSAGSQIPQLAYGYRAETNRFRVGNFGGPGGGAVAVRATAGGNASASASAAPASAAPVSAAAVGTQGQAPSMTVVGPDGKATTLQIADLPPELRGEAVPEGVTLLKPAVDNFQGVNVNPSFFLAYGVSTAEGSLFTDEDAANNASTLVLGPGLAKTLFPDKTTAELVGQKVQLNGRIWTLVGVLEKGSADLSLANGNSLADLAFAPIRQQNFGGFAGPGGDGGPGGGFGQTRNLRFAVAKVSDLPAATVALTKYFDDKYGEGKVSISVPFDKAQLSQSGFERLLWIIVAFGVGTLVMALINLMNMMLTRALRRQTAMGIMAAMGADRQTLASLQAVEGGLMALVGTVIGVGLAVPLYELLYQAGKTLFNLQTKASFDWAALLMVTPALLVLTLLLALLPAWQTSKIEITTALRSE